MNRESQTRKLILESRGGRYLSVDTLEEARQSDNYYLIMDGDDGGQIYLSCPARLIECDEKTLKEVLTIIDENQWSDESRGYYFELYKPDEIITGGMDGGLALEKGLWIHDRLKNAKKLLEEIIIQNLNTKAREEKISELKQLLPAH